MQALASSVFTPAHTTFPHIPQTFMFSAVFLTWQIALFSLALSLVRAAVLTLCYHSKDFPYTVVSFKHTENIQQLQPPAASSREAGIYTSSPHCLQGAG